MLTVTQIARRIPWLIMGLILVGGLLHLFGPAELERGELEHISAELNRGFPILGD